MKNRTAILKIISCMLLGCAMCCFAACAPRYPERPAPVAGMGSIEDLIAQKNEGQTAEDGIQAGAADTQDAAEEGKLSLDGEAYAEEMSSIRQEDMRKMGDALMYEGCSFSLLSYERTQEFGERIPENLSDWLEVDEDKNLTGDYYYIFLTLCITNESDVPVEVYRTHGEIAAVKENMEYATIGEPCYVDENYTGGEPSAVHAWKLAPGESITCEVGYIIEGDCLEDYLYYKFVTSEDGEFAERFINLE